MATATEPTVVNPLTLGTPTALLPQPCAFVIFGAAGDLSWRKLLPALYNLNLDGLLPSNFAVVGFGIGSQGDGDEWLRDRAREGIKKFSRQPLDDSAFADFARMLFYVEGSFNEARAYEQLKAKLTAVDQQFGIPGSRIYYLAVPPSVVEMGVLHLKNAGMVNPPGETRAFTRVIV
jgi:glucose-6-phosphate 1-dehydrogenase